MGAWGENAFENDAALDWLAEFETGGVATLRDTLSAVATTDSEDYVDVDDGSSAIAAAEIVAAAFGLRDVATKTVRRWLEAHQGALVDADRDLARRAVERVLDRNSELCALWEEGGTDSAWHADVRALLGKLGGDAGSKKAAPTRGKAASPSFEHEKQALLTFLSARGLEPDSHQLARIEASVDKQEVHRWLARVVSVTSVAELLDE